MLFFFPLEFQYLLFFLVAERVSKPQIQPQFSKPHGQATLWGGACLLGHPNDPLFGLSLFLLLKKKTLWSVRFSSQKEDLQEELRLID